jgi:hypothetical protein
MISDDKSIIHPTALMIDPQKFVLEILHKDIIEKIHSDKIETAQDPSTQKDSEQF